MVKKVVLFLGYNSRSYELVRRLRLSNLNLSNLELVHIPEPDDIALPSIVIEDLVDGKLTREEIPVADELRYYLEEIEDSKLENEDKPFSII
ncbi:MAG: hypothetical protein QXO98_01435 [Sulfolobales archaeon]